MAGEEYELDPELQEFVEARLGRSVIDLDALHASQDDPGDDETDEPDEETEEAPGEPDTPEEPGEGDDEGEPGPPPEGTPLSHPSAYIDLGDGRVLPRAQALAYYDVDSILNDDPELRQQIDDLVRGRAAGGGAQPHSPATPPPAVLPEIPEEYLEDEAVKALYDLAKQQQEQYAQMDQRLKQLSDVTINREAEEVMSMIQNTKVSYSKEHNLTDDEMEKVASVAERLNVVPALMQGVDPITGEHVPRDRTQALQRAFDIAYNYLPEFREREVERAVAERAKSQRRKQRLAGVSGTSGSVPKNAPAPRNEQERRSAMINAVAEMIGQSTIEE